MLPKIFKVIGLVVAITLTFNFIFALVRPGYGGEGGIVGLLLWGFMLFCILWFVVE